MNPPNNKNKKSTSKYQQSDSIVLNLEMLSMRYRNLLIEYENAVNNYISFLRQEAGNEKISLVRVNNSAYWGTTTVSQVNSSTVQECQASCATNTGCTGATYNSANSICYLRGGDGDLTRASNTEVAIVPKGKQLLSIIKNINQQLTNINQQIQNKTNQGQPLYNSQTQQRNLKTSELIRQFIILTEERNKIEQMVNEYQKLDQQQNQGNIMINQNYYSFVLLLFLAVIIIIILFYFGGGDANSKTNLNSQTQSSSSGSFKINTGYAVIIIFLFALLIACISIVLSKTSTNISGLSKSLIPINLPQINLSKFAWQ
jgi:hypothetical protein